MYEFAPTEIQQDRITQYQVFQNGRRLTYADTIDKWMHDKLFRDEFNAVFRDSPFRGLRFETPSICSDTVDQPFEFVLLNSPSFCDRSTDTETYRHYFTDEEQDVGVVAFSNLGGDAKLIVPSPRAKTDAYGHLAAFCRGAPFPQQDALWQVVGREMQLKVAKNPVWLNTAGGGVAWLHIRIDDRPKYYGFAKYRVIRG